ncbi:hypothetical protein R3P38DRAFT_3194841 [Favolaschia claudopus]|uniref:Uncharacterized protein n=1 Tax=Favolaschia claudopus TaxID=2862362 RepID=A0AAW0BDH2_9AGAR
MGRFHSAPKSKSNTATDVWFFVRLLEANIPPVRHNVALPDDSDLLKSKPNVSLPTFCSSFDGSSAGKLGRTLKAVERWVDRLIRWIVADDHSLDVVDCEEFREFVLFGRAPEHCTALTNKIIPQYRDIYKKIVDDRAVSTVINYGQSAYSRLRLTGDMRRMVIWPASSP